MPDKIDALVIGGGPAGMAAALSLRENGIEKIVVAEREDYPGGVLLQCIHNGFGLQRFKEELTGPEYAERDIALLEEQGIRVMTGAAALDISKEGEDIRVLLLSKKAGVVELAAKTVILAMGCRERNRGNISIPGSRPAGIMTAGLAQKLVNTEGYLPGKEVVILGSGDIGLIMARRMTWEGAIVKAVVEIQPFPGGLQRNITQCLDDFKIPLYLAHTVSKIMGNKRIEAVEICPIDASRAPIREKSFVLSCDTLLLSVGLVPENELSRKAGIEINPVTNGPFVDDHLMTSVPGVFACGNVLHVHDIVDYVSQESFDCGKAAADYIKGQSKAAGAVRLQPGNMVRYVVPRNLSTENKTMVSLRPMTPMKKVKLVVGNGTQTLFSKKFQAVHPSEMIRVGIPAVLGGSESMEVRFEMEDV